jgi:hypothetical protein
MRFEEVDKNLAVAALAEIILSAFPVSDDINTGGHYLADTMARASEMWAQLPCNLVATSCMLR